MATHSSSTPAKRLRVAVLYGGRSGEHEVSLASAAAVFANLDRSRYEPIAIRLEKDGRWVLADRPPSAASAAEVIEQSRHETGRLRSGREVLVPAKPGTDTLMVLDKRQSEESDAIVSLTGLAVDVVFPVLHGPYGEDGTVQGLLELANVPYVGCGVLASAVGMDKLVMKTVFSASGLRVPDWVAVSRAEWRENPAEITRRVERDLSYPLFVKPANLGSSLGISKVAGRGTLAAAIDEAARYDRRIVVERAVPEAREIECAVLGNDAPSASVPGEIIPSREFYDYEAKYIDGMSRLEIPARLDDGVADQVKTLAIAAFKAIDGAGLARVDFLLSRSSGELFVNEINTMPGFTTISMYSKLWAASGVDYPTLVDRLIALAIERQHERQK
ncbi:MAG TPA: D-alanine--D-alanine ligase family protein [Vicinamibacterales bacterium]|nr:D-alanine--D-alanine ligase family protein [Vicinamibacterales bacterium]